MKTLENEYGVLKGAAQGDGAALAKIDAYLKEWIIKHGKDHATIEMNRLCICALGVSKTYQVEALEKLMKEMINQA
nr:hypothetical protein [uncultured Carboxylicivirga sp.]